MMEIKLIQATEKDLDSIARLAKITWNQYYPAIISQNQIDYMLEKMYSLESLNDQITKKGDLFFLISQKNQELGFISVNLKSENSWFLNKFYLDQSKAQKGIGTKSFKMLRDKLKAKKISLTVNRQNFKAINFYFKNGFKIQEVADFDIGNGFVMNDFIMVWEEKQSSL